MENFAEIAQTFLDNGAAIQIREERERDEFVDEYGYEPEEAMYG